MKCKILGINICLLMVFSLFAANVSGDEMQFDLEWVPQGTFATGSITGTAIIDTDVLSGLSSLFNEPIATSGFTSIEVTVSGTGTGDGTFSTGAGDINTVIWQTAGPIDFSTELVGQANLLDFNLGFPASGGAPFGFGANLLSTDGGTLFALSSFRPSVVPEPSSLLLCTILSTGIVLRRRR